MQKNSTLQNYSLPFSPSSLFSLFTPSFLCSVQESGYLQPAFEWLSIHARIKHRWAELQVIEVQSEENGFILHLTCQKNPGITAQCTLHVSDGLLTASLDSQSKMIEALAIDFTAQPNEHFLGFGERFNR
ncbi:MAG: hypothetical protein HGB14_07490, partial [Anaerolineaceae bacterium]|nr:hypothetical protein [Anaerolineaceae bacterium]